MYFKIACPQCTKGLKVRTERAGHKANCPYCQATFRIPQAPDMSGLGLTQGADAAASGGAPQSGGAGAQPPVETGGGGGGDVSIVLSGAIGLGIAIAGMAVVFPFKDTYVWELFFDRGWVPYVLTWQFGWSMAILLLKYLNVKRQKQAMILDLLPAEISENITAKALDRFASHISGLPVKVANSMLITRVLRGIEHFRVRQSAADTYSMMSSQSEIDANIVAGSYAMLKYFIWAIPIMGFIGTVIGISGGVAVLSDGFSGAADTAQLKASLGGLMTNLATAFDTTLLALVMSIFVKLPVDAMRKTEDGLVTWVDEYCNENFLRRLDDGSEAPAGRKSGGLDPEMFQQVVQANLAQQQKQFEAWLGKIDGSELTKKSAEAWDKVSTDISARQSRQLESWSSQMKNVSETLAGDMGKAWKQVAAEVGQQREAQQKESAAWQERVEQSGEKLAGRVDQAFDRVTAGLVEERTQQQKQFDAWIGRLEKVGETLAAQSGEAWTTLRSEVSAGQAEQQSQQQQATDGLVSRLEELTGKLATQSAEQWQQAGTELTESRTRQEQQAEAAFGRLEEVTRSLAEQNEKTLSNVQSGGEQLGQVSAALAERLEALVEQAESLQSQVGGNVAETQRTIAAQFEGLQEGLSTLSRVLQDLGEQQVIVQQVEPPRRGWFSRKSNGAASPR